MGRHPFTNVSAERDSDVGADTGSASKPGGSDAGTDEMLLLGGSSSTTASLIGRCNATGGREGAGPGAKTLLSWVNVGTSKKQEKHMRGRDR